MEGARSFHETAQQQRQRKSVRGCRWSFQADRRAEDCGYWKGFSTTRPIRGYRTRLREPATSPGWLSERLGFARSCSFRRPSSAGSQYLKFTRNSHRENKPVPKSSATPTSRAQKKMARDGKRPGPFFAFRISCSDLLGNRHNFDFHLARHRRRGDRRADFQHSVVIFGSEFVGDYALGKRERALELAVHDLIVHHFLGRANHFPLTLDGQQVVLGMDFHVLGVNARERNAANELLGVFVEVRLH